MSLPPKSIPLNADRRRFLKLGAAAAALATAGCAPPPERNLPYVHAPEHRLPGVPRYYATTMTLAGFGAGLLVEDNMGRPIKVEGNPSHPASLGATDVFAQAAVLEMWDPDRSKDIVRAGAIETRSAFLTELEPRLAALQSRGGEGLAVLSALSSSPTLLRQREALLERYPKASWHWWEPLHHDEAIAGARAAFGRPLQSVYEIERADVVLAVGGGFMSEAPGWIAYARALAARRGGASPEAMNRLYVVESDVSLAGSMADHRWAMQPGAVEAWLASLARALGLELPGAPAPPPNARAVAGDLARHRGRCVIIPSGTLSAEAQALVHALNERLQAAVRQIEPVAGAFEPCAASIAALADEMRAGKVGTLAMLGANPVYDAPADLDFAGALARVPFSVHLGLHADETARRSTWHLPQSHFLESWSDARAFDGTASLVQPLIAPLYRSLSAHELLAILMREYDTRAYDTVRETWRGNWAGGSFEDHWSEALRSGVVAGSAHPRVQASAAAPAAAPGAPSPQGWTLLFRADPSVRAGEFANNAWLQELPRPQTQLTWDNAALLSPASAAALGLGDGDVVEISAGERKLVAPVWRLPGHVDHAITLPLGYGRRDAGGVGDAVGFDAYPLRGAGAQWTLTGAAVRATGARHVFAVRQEHMDAHHRDIVRHADLAEFREHPEMFEEKARGSLYPEWRYDGYKWGMAIDLNACIGCGACTVACQAENNIPTVGKEQVRIGRILHWIRVDKYETGRGAIFQPVPCMQCEKAPCELVCPVEASIHDSEGLNVQVYNRCVGTRFCSQNCPYKVRRFNFLQYADTTTEELKAVRNPEVTVRQRGVMEKCTYCVQRITRARIKTEVENRRIRDGEVVTACQAVCPTRAITFGDLNDPSSQVLAAKASRLDYALLGELNTQPRTTYLARLRNPNPALEDG